MELTGKQRPYSVFTLAKAAVPACFREGWYFYTVVSASCKFPYVLYFSGVPHSRKHSVCPLSGRVQDVQGMPMEKYILVL